VKRIALIRNSYPYDVGGAEIFPLNMGKVITNYGYFPIILSANIKTLKMAKVAGLQIKKSPWWSFQNFSGIKVLLFPIYLIWVLFLVIWYFLFIFKNRIDIIHPQSRDDFISATIAAKILSKKVIWTDHADLKYIYANHETWYKNPVGKLVYLVSKLADNITLVSKSEKALIENRLGHKLPNKCQVIHNGVTDKAKNINKSYNKDINFVMTSRLVTAKGIGEAIQAYKILNQQDKAKLIIYGDGPESRLFNRLATDIKGIEMVGHIDKVTKALMRADVFVHPSYHEGFSLSLIEATMCSLPIIACRVGGNPEIVKEGVNGLLIKEKDPGSLANAMRYFIENPDLIKSMGRKSRDIYLENFQFNKIVKEKFLPLYEK